LGIKFTVQSRGASYNAKTLTQQNNYCATIKPLHSVCRNVSYADEADKCMTLCIHDVRKYNIMWV